MRTKAPNLKKILNLCNENNFFDADTLYLKQNIKSNIFKLIAVCGDNGFKGKKKYKTEDDEIVVYYISYNSCMSLMLNKDILFFALFSSVVCLKDDLSASRAFYQALIPIKKYNNLKGRVSLDNLWKDNILNRKYEDELSIQFRNISNENEFYQNILIPLSSSFKNLLHHNSSLLQFEECAGKLNATYTLKLKEKDNYNSILNRLIIYLYKYSPELNLSRIAIPYVRMRNRMSMDRKLSCLIADVITQIQTEIFSKKNNEGISSNTVITTLMYAFIIAGCIMYKSKADFNKVVEKIYKKYSFMAESDVQKYMLSLVGINTVQKKLFNELHALCLSNAVKLNVNYGNIMNKWKTSDFNNDFKDFVDLMRELNDYILSEECSFTKDQVFEELTKVLFHSFNIHNYYKSFILFSIKFLANEI